MGIHLVQQPTAGQRLAGVGGAGQDPLGRVGPNDPPAQRPGVTLIGCASSRSTNPEVPCLGEGSGPATGPDGRADKAVAQVQ
jgi:hypothetical protein